FRFVQRCGVKMPQLPRGLEKFRRQGISLPRKSVVLQDCHGAWYLPNCSRDDGGFTLGPSGWQVPSKHDSLGPSAGGGFYAWAIEHRGRHERGAGESHSVDLVSKEVESRSPQRGGGKVPNGRLLLSDVTFCSIDL